MNKEENSDTSKLSEANTNLIVILIFISLLIFGPIEPYGTYFRVAYLIIIPLLAWLILRYFNKKNAAGALANEYLNRAIYAVVAGILLCYAYSALTSKTHLECSQYINTRDGHECIGDYVTRSGPDKTTAITATAFAICAFWLAITKKKTDET